MARCITFISSARLFPPLSVPHAAARADWGPRSGQVSSEIKVSPLEQGFLECFHAPAYAD